METIRPTIPRKPKKSNENNKNKAAKNPLEWKTVKVPAVFRLLNPEFLEQFRDNSFKVGTITESRNIPVQKRYFSFIVLSVNFTLDHYFVKIIHSEVSKKFEKSVYK